MNVYEKLLAVQSELNAPKSQYNKFGNYRYRKAEDILEAVKPICVKYKATIILSDYIEVLEGRHYIKAIAEFTDVENPGDRIIATAFAREEGEKKGMDASQVTGAASSYARKYALNGLLAIDDNQDSDTTNVGDGKQEKKPAPRQNKPAPVPTQSTEKIAGMSKSAYLKTVDAAVQGKDVDGMSIRDWFISKYKPTVMELHQFDLDVNQKSGKK